jgi:hypothetical protein
MKTKTLLGIHFGFRKSDNFGGEFDEWQATLPHEVVNCSPADAQAPGHL